MRDFSKRDIEEVISESLRFKAGQEKRDYNNKSVASLFFEPSTRTRESFEVALRRMNCDNIIGFAGTEGTSVKKGEPLADTVRMYEGYGVDALVIRHPLEGSARFVSEVLKIPVINGGDGSNGHPTQAFLDFMTIKEHFGRIDGLRIAFVGDNRYGRTVHSNLQGLEHYDVDITLVSPPGLELAPWRVNDYQRRTGKTLRYGTNINDVLDHDIIYVLRVQRERFPEGREGDIEFQRVSGVIHVNRALLNKAKPTLRVMHPFPRYKHRIEIALDVDDTPHALYLEEAKNGVPTRQNLFDSIFGEGFDHHTLPPSNVDYAETLPVTRHHEKRPRFYIFEDGTFIDHIEPGVGYKLRPLLGLMDYRDSTLLAVNNLPSRRFGSKDVYGITDKYFTPEQLWKIALVSDRATINIIRGGEVQQKFKVRLPPLLEGIVACTNPMCVSYEDNHEHVTPKFHVESQQPLSVRCHYCERPVGKEDLKIIY